MAKVELVMKEGSAWFRGTIVCAQVWACPVCAYRIATGRARELSLVIENHKKTGGGVYLVTATIPHDQGDRLKKLRGAVAQAWSKSLTGKTWIRLKERVKYAGYVRALEVTKGPNGWHPHLHVLIFTDAPLSDGEKILLESYLFERWSFYIQKQGYRAPHRDYGIKLSEGGDAGKYVTKIVRQGLAAEVADGQGKNAKTGSRSILDIADDFHRTKDPNDKALLVEWIKSMYGARQLTWGGDIRIRYKKLMEASDEALAEKEEAGGQVFFVLPAEFWDTFFSPHFSNRWTLIRALERDGPEKVLFRFLDIFGSSGRLKEFLRFQLKAAGWTTDFCPLWQSRMEKLSESGGYAA